MVAVAIIVGSPIGLVAGRLAWTSFASRTGVLQGTLAIWFVLLIVAGPLLVLANGSVLGPAFRARRVNPADTLRVTQ